MLKLFNISKVRQIRLYNIFGLDSEFAGARKNGDKDLADYQSLLTSIYLANIRNHVHLFGLVENTKIQATKGARGIGVTERIW